MHVTCLVKVVEEKMEQNEFLFHFRSCDNPLAEQVALLKF